MKDNVVKVMMCALVVVGAFQVWTKFKSTGKMHHDVRTNLDYGDIESGDESDASSGYDYTPTPTGGGSEFEYPSDVGTPTGEESTWEE